jgi:ABC-type nitrate/sulfonate/bicarbonate transport system substrate-binding protein
MDPTHWLQLRMYHRHHELPRALLQHKPTSLRMKMPAGQLGRRRFLQLSAMVTGAALLPAGCRRQRSGELTMSLGWVPDVEYADVWVALDRHYIAEAGLRFTYLPGGPNAPQPVLEISAGEADLGDCDWLPFCDAIAQGNDFVILASLFPVGPAGLISLSTRPVRTPSDLMGKRFLVQGPNERAMLQALFRINGLKENYTTVPVGYSAEPLLEGAGDAYFCFVTNQPQSLARMGLREDADFYVTRLYDLGYRVCTSLLTIERKTLQRRRSEIVRFLGALLRGHAANVADPSYGARLAVDHYGADLGLDLEQQTRLNRLQISLEMEPGAQIPFWFSEEAFAGSMYSIARVSGRPPLPAAAHLRDMSLLEEAYHAIHWGEAIR